MLCLIVTKGTHAANHMQCDTIYLYSIQMYCITLHVIQFVCTYLLTQLRSTEDEHHCFLTRLDAYGMDVVAVKYRWS